MTVAITVEEQVVVQEFDSLESFAMDLIGEPRGDEQLWERLEKEHPDFSFTMDVQLSALLDDLQYQGLMEEQILEMNKAQYGSVIDLYKIGTGEKGSYILAVGAR